MKKAHISLTIVLTLLLLLGLAFLPRLVGALQDRLSPRLPGESALYSFDPELYQNRETLSIPEKLALLSGSETMTIFPAMTSMTEAEVWEAAESQLQFYIDAGLLHSVPAGREVIQPLVALDQHDPSQYVLYWTLNFSELADGKYRYLLVELDDETGKLLAFDYKAHVKTASDPTEGLTQANFSRVENLYFEQAGMTEAAAQLRADSRWYHSSFREAQGVQMEETAWATYCFTDKYGEHFYIDIQMDCWDGFGVYLYR